MKALEELSTIAETNILQMVPKIILDTVEEAARARRFGRNLIKINDDLVRTKGRSIVIGRRGTLTAAAVSEGTTCPATNFSYTSTTITPSKIGVASHITEEAIEGVELNLIQDVVTEAGISLADKEDADIIKALLGYTATTLVADASTQDVSSSSTRKLVYVDETNASVLKVDYYNARISTTGAATITYWYSTNTYFYDVASACTLAYEDIVGAVADIKGRKWDPKFIVIHPANVGNILKSTMFIDASKYGSNQHIVTGELGSISGLKVLSTTNMPSTGCALVIDPSRAAWMAMRRTLDMKRWDNPATDAVELYFYMEYGVAVSDQDALEIIVDFTPLSDKTLA
jgi:N4-gp56 family major capsid protein